jgi:hypothetical protein
MKKIIEFLRDYWWVPYLSILWIIGIVVFFKLVEF